MATKSKLSSAIENLKKIKNANKEMKKKIEMENIDQNEFSDEGEENEEWEDASDEAEEELDESFNPEENDEWEDEVDEEMVDEDGGDEMIEDEEVEEDLVENPKSKKQRNNASTDDGQLVGANTVDKEDDLEYDLARLLATDIHPMDSNLPKGLENYLMERARENTQLLINKLFQLPSEAADVGRLAVLPPPVIQLPREKPIPVEKPLTKWEQYKRDNRLKTRKKEKLVFDELSGTWKERYGPNKANKADDNWIVEDKGLREPGTDPWSEASKDKKQRKKKLEQRQAKNIARAATAASSVPGSFGLANKGASGLRIKQGKRFEKKELKDAFEIARVSTASMGKFDKAAKNEVRKASTKIDLKGKRHKFDGDLHTSEEKSKNLNLLERMNRKKNKVELASNSKAANVYQQSKEKKNSFKNRNQIIENEQKHQDRKKKRHR